MSEEEQQQPRQPQQPQPHEEDLNNPNAPIFLAPGPDTNKKRPAAKYVWLITHEATGPRITPQMLKDKGNLDADECHSTVEADMYYTYVHLKKKARYTAFDKFMANARAEGIVPAEIQGYDAIASASTVQRCMSSFQIENHKGFKILARHIREGNEAFVACTDGVINVLTRGCLYKVVADVIIMQLPVAQQEKRKRDDLDRLPKKRLAEVARGYRVENGRLKTEVDELRRMLEETDRMMADRM